MNNALTLGVLLLISGGLMATDFWVKELPHYRVMTGEESPVAMDGTMEPTDAMMSSSSSSKRIVKKGTSTKKASGATVEELIAALGLQPTETSEVGILGIFFQSRAVVRSTVLLQNNDRAYFLSWVEDDDVKSEFGDLKLILADQFTPRLEGLVDETRFSESGTPMDVLSFLDPGISAERVTLLRVRNRLYEVRATAGAEAGVTGLLEALAR